MAHDIFISYSTKDKHTADAICHVLEQNGLKCWIAPRNITGGKNYAAEIIDGLKIAKIVVLVFSKNSQESIFVNNEIDNAFSNNKPIISFKIDESMPKDKMEFFLKNKHWLDAYPDPEKVFETLTRDALRLCNEHENAPNIVKNVKKVTANKLPTRTKDVASFVFLFTPLYFLSFIYMGILTRVKEWIIGGVIFIIPLLLIAFSLLNYPVYPHAAFSSMSFKILFALWVVAFIWGLSIRKEFLARKTVLNMMSSDEELYEDLVKEYSRM